MKIWQNIKWALGSLIRKNEYKDEHEYFFGPEEKKVTYTTTLVPQNFSLEKWRATSRERRRAKKRIDDCCRAIDIILELMNQYEMNYTEIGLRVGISGQQISNLRYGYYCPSASTLEGLEDLLRRRSHDVSCVEECLTSPA